MRSNNDNKITFQDLFLDNNQQVGFGGFYRKGFRKDMKHDEIFFQYSPDNQDEIFYNDLEKLVDFKNLIKVQVAVKNSKNRQVYEGITIELNLNSSPKKFTLTLLETQGQEKWWSCEKDDKVNNSANN